MWQGVIFDLASSWYYSLCLPPHCPLSHSHMLTVEYNVFLIISKNYAE